MIYGIGVDLVHIPRIERVLHRWGERFTHRVFTVGERMRCLRRPRPAAAFALYFAAKEAFSKAIGLGMRQGVRWADIEVIHDRRGKPGLRLGGASASHCRREGVVFAHLSLSDDGAYGMAMVVLEKAGGDESGRGNLDLEWEGRGGTAADEREGR